MEVDFIELKEKVSYIYDESIYYLYDYCSKKKIDKLNTGYISYASFICLKNYHALDHCDSCQYSSKCLIFKHYDIGLGYNTKRFKFVNAIANALTNKLPLQGEWIIMCVPGSQSSGKNNNPCNNLLSCCVKRYDGFDKLKFDYDIRNALFRKTTVTKNHLSDSAERRDYNDNKNSLGLSDKKLIKNKNIILIDDITTQGTTLIASRDFLLSNGASRVIMLSVGKTL